MQKFHEIQSKTNLDLQYVQRTCNFIRYQPLISISYILNLPISQMVTKYSNNDGYLNSLLSLVKIIKHTSQKDLGPTGARIIW